MNFPTLYKRNSSGTIQYWTISVSFYDGHGIITTNYGQLGTDSPQETSDIISQGKNIGKKNGTTAEQQAEAEALAKWIKQVKKGYIESLELAKMGKVSDLIEGGIVPMLAHKFAEQGHKIKYPAYVQPKLDGIRCIAILNAGKCTLWSRTRKPITGVPHIAKFIEENFSGEIVFDGELYNHIHKTNFEKIVSLVRQEEAAEGHEIVQYHVYDLVTEDTFEIRTRILGSMLFHSMNTNGPLVEVDTCGVVEEVDIGKWFTKFKELGYEGCMVRNAKSLYVNKRSYDLQKVKTMLDEEFKIVGIEEGRGKLFGHVGSFVCSMNDGKTFLAKMSGDTEMLKKYFEDHSLWLNKKLTVQFQDYTGANSVPRFPVGIAIRDYE
jgi:ATP-dependent DNA ligase